MSRIVEAVRLIKDICSNWNVGYDQSNRQDIRPGGETDCSALVIFVLRSAGFQVGGATYTGNMRSELTAHGFTCLSPGADLMPGDVLLSDAYHTAMYVGDGLVAQASIDERGEISGGQSGDQSGWETNVRPYYDYPWDCVLRPPADGVNEGARFDFARSADLYNPNGYTGAYVREVQTLLNGHGYGLEVDEILGANTFAAVKDYQAKNGLAVDGIPGPDTMGHLRSRGKAATYLDVRNVQIAVRAAVDNIVGSDTCARVEALKAASNYGGVQFPYGVEFAQRVVGTVSDGIWGDKSRACHDTTTGDLQRALRGLGYDIAVDEVYGPETDAAAHDALNRGQQA